MQPLLQDVYRMLSFFLFDWLSPFTRLHLVTSTALCCVLQHYHQLENRSVGFFGSWEDWLRQSFFGQSTFPQCDRLGSRSKVWHVVGSRDTETDILFWERHVTWALHSGSASPSRLDLTQPKPSTVSVQTYAILCYHMLMFVYVPIGPFEAFEAFTCASWIQQSTFTQQNRFWLSRKPPKDREDVYAAEASAFWISNSHNFIIRVLSLSFLTLDMAALFVPC